MKMNTKLEELKKKWNEAKNASRYKVFSCPNCRQKLRIPIKLGKNLLVTCSACRGQIQIRFPHPKEQLEMLLKTPSFRKKLVFYSSFIISLVALLIYLNH